MEAESPLGEAVKIWTLSDLHLTFDQAAKLESFGPVPEADVCVMAGDLCRSLSLGLRWLSKVVLPHMPVVYVPGNHDFFDTSIAEGLLVARAVSEMAGVTFLHDDTAEIGGVRFAGNTLWTDYALYAPGDGQARAARIAADMDASRGKADHARIRVSNDEKSPGFRFLQPEDTAAIHGRSVAWIESVLEEACDGPTVVVTHHAPHPLSIDPAFKGDSKTPSYVSDLSGLISRRSPDLWLHGHVHQAYDYSVGRTRVLCNPRGYAHETPAFEWGKTVSV